MAETPQLAAFEAERPRLLKLATHVLGDPHAAHDVVQQAWLRLHGTTTEIESLPAWLTTVTTRLCLDQLRARTPEPADVIDVIDVVDDDAAPPDPADDVLLADTVGVALQVMLDRLTPRERVAFVLHDTFAFDFTTIAAILDATPESARKLASRARAKVGRARADDGEHPDGAADWEVVDAFMAAARGGDLARLLTLLAPDAVVTGDAAAVALGTPARITGREEAAAFFNGAARAALPVLADGRPGAAWFDRGEAKVVFDFTVINGVVSAIEFRADPALLATVRRR